MKALTPITELRTPKGVLLLKREDLSETGSHKCRYLQKELTTLKEQGHDCVVLSTTGNVGITASKYARKLGMKAICVMADKGDMNKAAQIEAEGGILVLSPRPLRWARYFQKKYELPLLRGSQSETALEGYRELGQEIQEQAPNFQRLYNFCTSGTSTLGISQAFEAAGKALPELHIVQSGRSNSLVKELHPEQVPEDAQQGVGLEEAAYHEEILELIKKSGGDAHYADQALIQSVKALCAEQDLEISWECQATLAVAMAEQEEGRQDVVIISGKAWPDLNPQQAYQVDSMEEADQVWHTNCSEL